jgi:hypothetical protein
MFSQKLLLASILIANRRHLLLTFLYKNFLLKRMFTYLGSRFFHSICRTVSPGIWEGNAVGLTCLSLLT